MTSKRSKKTKCRRICRRITLTIIGFLIGIVCSFVLYFLLLLETDIDSSVKFAMLLGICIFLSFGFAFSRQIRCLACLMFPEFGSQGGKRAIQASLFVLILSGPLENIGNNAEEVLRFVSCSKNMLLDILVQGKNLLLAPIEHIIDDIMKQEDSGVNVTIGELSQVIAPIEEEVEDKAEIASIKLESDQVDAEMGNARRSQDLEEIYRPLPGDSRAEKTELMYKKKLAYRCEDIFTKGTEKCKEAFQDKYDKCYDAVTWILAWLLCWPMKLTFICDIIGSISQAHICNAAKIVEEGFGENYVAAKKGATELMHSMDVNISFPVLKEFSTLDEKMKKHQEDLLSAFIRNRQRVHFVFEIIKRFLAPSFLFIVLRALKYQRKYFKTLYFDNMYITDYFRRIDNRRKSLGKTHLLPLKSYERNDYTRVIRFRLTEAEAKNFLVQLLVLTVAAGVTATIFLFDFLLVSVLESLKRHGKMEIEQTGHHSLEIRIEGEGFIAKLLRKVIKDFSYAKEISFVHTSDPCLPNASRLLLSYYYRTVLYFVVLLSISYMEAHCLRTRNCISNFFFPKRCKKRILWRYNESLKKRKRKMREMKRRIEENIEEKKIHVDFNPVWAFAEMFPRCCRWLRLFKLGRRKCILCKRYGEFFRCPLCNYSYCKECFKDMDSKCLFCEVRRENDFQNNSFDDYDVPV